MEVVRSSESSAASNPSPDGNQPLHRQHDVDGDGDLDGGDDDEGERGRRDFNWGMDHLGIWSFTISA